MQGSGSGRAPLTNESSDDRPSWSPDGAFVAFMSSGRHGNPEIYTVNTTSGAVTRLTENSSVNALPVWPERRVGGFCQQPQRRLEDLRCAQQRQR